MKEETLKKIWVLVDKEIEPLESDEKLDFLEELRAQIRNRQQQIQRDEFLASPEWRKTAFDMEAWEDDE